MTDVTSPCPRVLIADNDAGVAGVLRMFLERAGLTVEIAEDGGVALERLRTGGIDLLVCDLDMPRVSGEEVLDELRGWAARPPVVVVSGYVDARLEAWLDAHPAVSDVLRKPFDLIEFGRRAAALARPAGTSGGASGELGHA